MSKAADQSHDQALQDDKEDAFFSCDVRYPFVATTYRVSEHWQTGVMTRHVPWQLEMQPQMFVEMSEELAKEKGIKNGEKVIVKSGRGELWAIAIVTTGSSHSRSPDRPCTRSAFPGISAGSIPRTAAAATAPTC